MGRRIINTVFSFRVLVIRFNFNINVLSKSLMAVTFLLPNERLILFLFFFLVFLLLKA